MLGRLRASRPSLAPTPFLGYLLRDKFRLFGLNFPQGVAVKIPSSSLVATGCTLCIAAASGTVAPHAAAAAVPEPAVTRDVALSASVDPLELASLPLQNLITTIQAVTGNNKAYDGIGVSEEFITPLNAAWGQFAAGDVDAISGTLQKGAQSEIAAIANLLKLPVTLIQQDLAAIGLMSSSSTLARSNSLAAGEQSVSTPALAAADPAAILLGLASLPLQNLITIIQAFTGPDGVTSNIVNPLNTAWAAFAAGNVDQIGPILEAGFQGELEAIVNLLKLPVTLTQYNVTYIQNLFGATQLAVGRSASLANEPVLQVQADPITGLLTIASLPLQNTIDVIQAITGDGVTNGIGVTENVITPLNTAWAQFAAGEVEKIPTTLQTGFTNELAAINHLLGLPATIVAQDVETIRNVFGGGVNLQATDAKISSSSAIESEPEVEKPTTPEADKPAAPAADESKAPEAPKAPKLDKPFGKHAKHDPFSGLRDRLASLPGLGGDEEKDADATPAADKTDDKAGDKAGDEKDADADKGQDKTQDKKNEPKTSPEKKSGPKHAKPDSE